MKYNIVNPQDSTILHETCEVFDFDNPQMDPIELYQLLVDKLKEHRGVGLSACQIGIPLRVFVMGHYSKPEEVLPVFNPTIVNYGKETLIAEEGCLSYPGLYVKVTRPIEIRVRFADEMGKINTHTMNEIDSRIFQHEYDHMDGITFHKRASNLQMHMALKQQKKLARLRRKAGEMSYV